MAKVEVFENDLDTWYPATLEGCDNDKATVAFPDNWKPRTAFPLNRVRLAAPTVAGYVPKEHDKVEALTRVQEVHAFSWFAAEVKKVEAGKFVYVTYPDGFDEILEVSRVRPVSTEPFLNPKMFTRVEIRIPDNLVEICRKEGEHNVFRDQCGLTSVSVSADGHSLVLTGSKAATDNGALLSTVHFRRLNDVKRIEDLRHLVETHSEQAAAAAITVQLPLSTDLIGLAIGKQGSNIMAARAVPGVTRVEIMEGKQNKHTILIQGHTAEAVAEARDLMEYCTEEMAVDRADVGFLIGREGRSLEEIIDRSGVSTIQTLSQPDDPQGKFEIVGRRSNVEKAKLLITATLDLLRESRQHIQESIALSNQLRTLGIRAPGVPARGRGRGRGGSSRGGPGRGAAAAAGANGGAGGATSSHVSSPAAAPAAASSSPAALVPPKSLNISVTVGAGEGSRVVSAAATPQGKSAQNKSPQGKGASAPAPAPAPATIKAPATAAAASPAPVAAAAAAAAASPSKGKGSANPTTTQPAAAAGGGAAAPTTTGSGTPALTVAPVTPAASPAASQKPKAANANANANGAVTNSPKKEKKAQQQPQQQQQQQQQNHENGAAPDAGKPILTDMRGKKESAANAAAPAPAAAAAAAAQAPAPAASKGDYEPTPLPVEVAAALTGGGAAPAHVGAGADGGAEGGAQAVGAE